jgi:2-iminoacetate synthase ThiH
MRVICCCRGIVEFSNVCQNDCGYCGIRKHMGGVKRYTIPIDEVVEVAKWAFENRMGTLMLQSGEFFFFSCRDPEELVIER